MEDFSFCAPFQNIMTKLIAWQPQQSQYQKGYGDVHLMGYIKFGVNDEERAFCSQSLLFLYFVK